MPYYKMNCQKAECMHSEDMLMKYDEMEAGVACPKCSGEMKNQICVPLFIKDFGTGGKRFIKKPNVGPMAKDSLAYEKKHDERISFDCNKPGGTFGGSGNKSFKEVQKRKGEAERGKTDFSKDNK